jgi:hypothetical protein
MRIRWLSTPRIVAGCMRHTGQVSDMPHDDAVNQAQRGNAELVRERPAEPAPPPRPRRRSLLGDTEEE